MRPIQLTNRVSSLSIYMLCRRGIFSVNGNRHKFPFSIHIDYNNSERFVSENSHEVI